MTHLKCSTPLCLSKFDYNSLSWILKKISIDPLPQLSPPLFPNKRQSPTWNNKTTVRCPLLVWGECWDSFSTTGAFLNIVYSVLGKIQNFTAGAMCFKYFNCHQLSQLNSDPNISGVTKSNFQISGETKSNLDFNKSEISVDNWKAWNTMLIAIW